MDLTTTLAGIGGAAVVFLLCWLGERRPRQFGQVRLFPYIPVMMVCMIAVLALAAHAISLVTGKHVGS